MKYILHHLTHFQWKAFLLLLLVLYFGHWLGTAVLEMFNEIAHHHPWTASILSGVLLTALVLTVNSLNHQYPRLRRYLFRILLWILSTLIVVTAYCAATWTEHAILDAIPCLKTNSWLFIGICLFGLASVSRVLRDILSSIEGPENIHLTNNYPSDPPTPLVLFVSLLNPNTLTFSNEESTASSFATVTTGAPGKTPTPYYLEGLSLAKDINALDESRWSWQQLLRAIEPHQDLKKIILIGSKHGFTEDSPGSFKLLDLCEQLLSPYTQTSCKIVKYPQAVPFEEFNTVKSSLRDIIKSELKKDPKGRVAVDVTGGQATASIAAAAATIGSEAIFQYVQTNSPFNILYYDIYNVHAPSPHAL